MKAEELMIGDWVRMHYPFDMDIDMRPERIKVLEKRVDIDCEPIPLTTEILEKNFSSTREWYFEGTDKYQLRITLYKDKWHFSFGRDGKRTNIQINIQYVHELQHALRACGIDKEIVL